MPHTKGPWNFDGHGINMAGGCRFATLTNVPQKYENETWNPMPRKEVEANACLIAAAPELLEALELLLNGAQAAVKNGLVNPQINGGIIKARAAIAKATGSAISQMNMQPILKT